MHPSTSSNPAIQAYKVYHLSQVKLDKECRSQTPDLRRIVCHASIVDNVRRWSRDLATPAETVVVDSESDTDSDPFEDSSSDDDIDEAEDAVAIFDIDVDDETTIEEQAQATGKVTYTVQHVEDKDSKKSSSSKKRSQQASKHELKSQTWKKNRPITIRETAIEVDADD